MLEHIIIIIPKDKRDENNPENFSLNNVLKIKTINCTNEYILSTKIENNSQNFIDKNSFKDYYTDQGLDLSIKVAIMKDNYNYYYAPYLPFSFRQAKFLYNEKIPLDFIQRHYIFTATELINGYAIREENSNKMGFYYYSENTVELPEFISREGLNHIMKIYPQ